MMGYPRNIQSGALNHGADGAIIIDFITEGDVATVLRTADPFGIAHDCINPAGHDPIASCGEVVCRHCARIF
jgi:hypothetical protein